jgi:isocitrate dehydrogenase (NAD+)
VGHRSINVALRKALELYANFRPVKSLPGVRTPFENVDLVIVRENTEDLYAGLEHTVVPGVVESLKIITERASTRIARFAFDYARKAGRKKIAAVHKAS